MTHALPLGGAPLHAPLLLTGVSVDGRSQRRLVSMGLRAGVRLSVQQRLAGGGRVVNVGGARVALGQAVVNGLLVREITQ